jgi:hypothetical protein
LDESACQLLYFPGRGGFTGAEADDNIADAHGLPGFQRQVARDAVALVEEAKDRDPLRHWRGAGRELGYHLGDIHGFRLSRGVPARFSLRHAVVATGECQPG